MPHLLRTKDFWAGVFLICFGALAVWVARNYPFGSTLRMGAGWFPTMLGTLLVGFGTILVLRGYDSTEQIEPGWSPRALIVVPLALAIFALLLERVGFVPALAVLLVGSAAAGTDFRPLEVLITTVVMTIASVAVFIWGLGLSWRLFVLPW